MVATLSTFAELCPIGHSVATAKTDTQLRQLVRRCEGSGARNAVSYVRASDEIRFEQPQSAGGRARYVRVRMSGTWSLSDNARRAHPSQTDDLASLRKNSANFVRQFVGDLLTPGVRREVIIGRERNPVEIDISAEVVRLEHRASRGVRHRSGYPTE
jgi:hypothetical protein